MILVIGGGFSLPKIDLANFNPFAGFGDGGDGSGDKVDVQKPLKFALTDTYAGSALTSKTLKVYASDGSTLLETLTTGSDGTITTAFTYDSGDIIWVYYESSNDKMWWKKEIPKMNPKDAEALSYNYLKLAAFSIGTYTTDTLKHGATSISDAGEYNFTTSGNIQTFTYSLANTGNDNTGLMESYDPIYQMKYGCVVYTTLSGTSYEKIIVYGFDYDYTLGTTHYVASEADCYALTKHKVGNTYKSNGVQDFTFSLDEFGIDTISLISSYFLYHYLLSRLSRDSAELLYVDLFGVLKGGNLAGIAVDMHNYFTVRLAKMLSDCRDHSFFQIGKYGFFVNVLIACNVVNDSQ